MWKSKIYYWNWNQRNFSRLFSHTNVVFTKRSSIALNFGKTNLSSRNLDKMISKFMKFHVMKMNFHRMPFHLSAIFYTYVLLYLLLQSGILFYSSVCNYFLSPGKLYILLLREFLTTTSMKDFYSQNQLGDYSLHLSPYTIICYI